MASGAGPQDDTPAELGGRFRSEIVLKRDHLSTIERGTFAKPEATVPAVLRRIDQTPIWTRWLARAFLKREARALAIAGGTGVAPSLLHVGGETIVRSWMDGLPLQLALPFGDRAYFVSAKAALRAIHRRGLTHNDLAKRPNWLRSPDGRALLTDFQLATHFPQRGRVFRLFAYEDVRHLLKHKRSFCESALTASERRVLARKAVVSRAWLAIGKPVYRLITRGIFHYADTEGGGRRLNVDAPAIAARLKASPAVREVAIVAYPDRRRGTGLYAFVEAVQGETEPALRKFLGGAANLPRPPEMLQVVAALPRTRDGAVRMEILQIIATNQVDLLDTLIHGDDERRIVDGIVAGRLNLLDRPALTSSVPPAR